MDQQVFDMLQSRFDQQDEVLRDIQTNLKEHVEKDQTYWKKIDVQEGQVGLLKWLLGGTITTLIGSFFAWITSTMKG